MMGNGTARDTVVEIATQTNGVRYRPVEQGDFEDLREAHVHLFPVDYEDKFFHRVVRGHDQLLSLMAVERGTDGAEQLIGFIVARTFKLHECDATDRELMGLGHKLLDLERAMYILTLGVDPHKRRKGVASHLIEWIVEQATDAGCRAVYLHVIDYNKAAISMYRKNGFSEMACRQNFYYIRSGRQPDLSQHWYDAFLYAHVIDTEVNRTPLVFVLALLAPLRDMVYNICSLFPYGTPRSTYFGNADYSSLPSPPKLKTSGSMGSNTTALNRWLKTLFNRKEDRKS